MKLGLTIGYSGANLRLPVERIIRAEELGYDSIWTAESYGSDAVSPLAYIAAITKRIREQLDGWEHFKEAGLTFSTAYRSLEAIKQNASESLEPFLERIAGNIQKLIDEEISLRMVENE